MVTARTPALLSRDKNLTRISVLRVPVEYDVLQVLVDAVDELLAQPVDVLVIVGHLLAGQLARSTCGNDVNWTVQSNQGQTRLTKSHSEGSRHCTRPESPLLPSSALNWFNAYTRPPAHVQRPHSLGTVHLVAADGHEVDVHVVHVHGDLADGLSRVSVQEDLREK